MTGKQLSRQAFIVAVKAIRSDCDEPLKLKSELEKDIGHMGFAETLRFIQNMENTGSILDELHERYPKETTIFGQDVARPTGLRGIIQTGKGRNEGSGTRRGVEEEVIKRSAGKENG